MSVNSSVRTFLFLTIFGLAFLGKAELVFANDIEVVDPDNVLSTLPGKSQSVDFANAFKCNQPTSFFVKTGKCRLHCEYGMCEEQCDWPQVVEATFQPEECTADSVAIYSSLGHSLLATPADYKASSESIALTIIKSVSMFYDSIEKVKVDQIMYPNIRTFIQDGQMKHLPLTTIFLSLYPDKTKPEYMGLSVTLDLQQSGLEQLMCVAENNPCESGNDYFMKRKGLINVQPK